MANILQKNLEALSKLYPDLVTAVSKVSCDKWELIDIEDSGEASFSFPIKHDLRNKNTNELMYHGKPIASLDDNFTEFPKKSPFLMFFSGIGLGYHVHYYLYHLDQNSQDIVIIEDSIEKFKHSLSVLDWRKIIEDPRIKLLIGKSENDQRNFFSEYIYDDERILSLSTFTSVNFIYQTKLEAQSYRRTNDIFLDEAGKTQTLILGQEEDSYRGFMNLINNLESSLDVPSFEALEGLFSGFPGILVSTGPSLQKSIEYLKEVKNKAVICCVDSAYKILLDHSIQPHFVCCLERVPETELLFTGTSATQKPFLVASPIIWPRTYQNYFENRLNLMRRSEQIPWFYSDQKAYASGSSASHLAYIILQTLGCSTIFLLGQDLAFDRYSKRTHMDGIPRELYEYNQRRRKRCEEKSKECSNQVEVEGNNGEPILTMNWFIHFRNVFYNLIRNAGIETYNVIPENYGIAINGSKRIMPDKMLSYLGPQKNIFYLIEKKLDKTADREGLKRVLKEKVEKACQYLKTYSEVSLDVLDATSNFRQEFSPEFYDSKTFDPFFKKVDQTAKQLFSDNEDFFNRFFYFQVINKNLRTGQRQRELSMERLSPVQIVEERIDTIRDWFSTVQYWSQRMLCFLERSRETGLRFLFGNSRAGKNMSATSECEYE